MFKYSFDLVSNCKSRREREKGADALVNVGKNIRRCSTAVVGVLVRWAFRVGRKKTSKSISTLLVVFMLIAAAVAFVPEPVIAVDIIYIRANGYVDPPTASIYTCDLQTYYFSGNISSRIIIERQNIIVDGNGFTLYGSGSSYGFSLTSMNNITIRNTHIKNFLYGIRLASSQNNTVSRNEITENTYAGILLTAQTGPSTNNTIIENSVHDNFAGVRIDSESIHNMVIGNNITSNSHYGVYVEDSADNFIYHNNLVGNLYQAVVVENLVESWDNGYPSGGNYWSDYAGVDFSHGLHQNETGSDGIGDSPYVIDTENLDNFPLMSLWVEEHNLVVNQVIPDQTVIQQGDSINVTVAVANKGRFTEYFNLTLDANATLISILSVVQTASTVGSYTFAWNTTGYGPGGYYLRANATHVLGETCTADNSLAVGPVNVEIAAFSLEPTLSSTPVGELFNVNVTLVNVCNLTSWQFELFFESNIVNCTQVLEGPFLKSGGNTSFIDMIDNQFNTTHGRILTNCWLPESSSPVDGNGTLAILTFTALNQGNTTLNLDNTQLLNNDYLPQPIPHTTTSGTAQVTFTDVRVTPSSSTVPIGGIFDVNITVADVYNLTIWETCMYFDNTILNCTSVVEGPFLKSAGSTSFIQSIDNQYNTTHGRIQAGCYIVGNNFPTEVTGTLAILTFTALNQGNTTLNLDNTQLLNNDYLPQPIPHTTTSGTAQVVEVIHDVAVTNIEIYKTVTGKGYFNNFTVTLLNLGSVAETFNVTVYADILALGTQQTTLEDGKQVGLMFSWNTSGWGYGTYIIKAYASPITDENNTTNNEYVGGYTDILMPGDVVANFGSIDMRDISFVARRFLISHADPLWNANADIDSDGKVDMRDVAVSARNFAP